MTNLERIKELEEQVYQLKKLVLSIGLNLGIFYDKSRGFNVETDEDLRKRIKNDVMAGMNLIKESR